MALYEIEYYREFDSPHRSEIFEDLTYGKIELSNEEVTTLVKLIQEKGTTDVEVLKLQEIHPDLYEKLRVAYYNLAYNAEELISLWTGFDLETYNVFEVLEHCESNCGYTFEYEEEDYIDEDGELDEDMLEDDKIENFTEWLEDYLYDLSHEEAKNFFYEHLNGAVDLDDLTYNIDIPDEIIELARGK